MRWLILASFIIGPLSATDFFSCEIIDETQNQVAGELRASTEVTSLSEREYTTMDVLFDMDFQVQNQYGEPVEFRKTFLAPFNYFPEHNLGHTGPAGVEGQNMVIRFGGLWVNFENQAEVTNGHMTYNTSVIRNDNQMVIIEKRLSLRCGVDEYFWDITSNK